MSAPTRRRRMPMKIQPRTKLSPADLLSYEPGRGGIGASSKAFHLDPPDLSPLKPGLSSKAAQGSKLDPLNVAPFQPGHPGTAELKPLDLSERATRAAAAQSADKSQHDQLTDKAQK